MSHSVTVVSTGDRFQVEDGEVVLTAGRRSHAPLPFECTQGICGTCRVHIEKGRVRYDQLPPALSAEEAEQGYALTCQAHAETDLEISLLGAAYDLPQAQVLGATLLDVRELTSSIRCVRLALDLPEDGAFEYRAGQHLNLRVPGLGERSFSMARAAASEGQIELHIRRIPEGRFTHSWLDGVTAGTRLEVEIPRGQFCYHADLWQPLLFVATGTGIAPIRAMLEGLLDDDNCPPISLYWGMRDASELYLAEELESWKSRLFEFDFHPVLSRASGDWQGDRGHVQDAISRDLPDLSEHIVYICGAPAMVADVKRLALGLGTPVEHIFTDSFAVVHRAD